MLRRAVPIMQASEFTTIVKNRMIQLQVPESIPDGANVRILVLLETSEADNDGTAEATFEAWDALLGVIPEIKES
jgi:hypothetical protein